MPSLVNDYAEFRKETARLTSLLASATTLAPRHRKYIAEVALLRLAILIENSMKTVFCKLCCGATFIDGATHLVR
jgi:RNase P subunit RPR2